MRFETLIRYMKFFSLQLVVGPTHVGKLGSKPQTATATATATCGQSNTALGLCSSSVMRVASFFFAIFLILMLSPTAESYPTANLSTIWTTNHSVVKPILHRKATGAQFTCGFYCEEDCTSYIFAIFISPTKSPEQYRTVWSANQDHPVQKNAILNFTAAGELVLKDVDGSIVWATNTTGKSVAGMNLTETGNLVLFDDQNSIVWQSFDYPTNSLLHGQKLFTSQKLISSVTNSSLHKDMYSLQVTNNGLFAHVESNPPQVYYSWLVNANDTKKRRGYLRFLNGSLSFFINSFEPSDPDGVIGIPPASSTQYLKLKRNGHLKVHEWNFEVLTTVIDLTENTLDECSYPLICGRNSICSTDEQCSCPSKEYFRRVNDRKPNLGCSEITPLNCNSTKDQDFLHLRTSNTSPLLPTWRG